MNEWVRWFDEWCFTLVCPSDGEGELRNQVRVVFVAAVAVFISARVALWAWQKWCRWKAGA